MGGVKMPSLHPPPFQENVMFDQHPYHHRLEAQHGITVYVTGYDATCEDCQRDLYEISQTKAAPPGWRAQGGERV